MQYLEIAFWCLLGLLLYTYFGYGVLIAFLAKIKSVFSSKKASLYTTSDKDLPSVCVLVAAFNEADFIEKKIQNSFKLDYPKDKISFLFVSDGSNDDTPKLIEQHKNIRHFHKAERMGKIAAVQRVMPHVESEIVVFTDANTLLNKDAVYKLIRHFKDEKVGAIAGEKRVKTGVGASASGAGEGIYWKYESLLKKWDSKFHTVVGAAGELFAIRKKLYHPVELDTLVEDFKMTMEIAANGYKVVYEPEAYAIEGPSDNITEEFKRKKRIAAGGWQAVYRLRRVLNPFKYGWLSFQYISHRVLRWTLAPFSLPLILLLNIFLCVNGNNELYNYLLFLQIFFYTLALIGWVLEQRKLKLKVFFVPFYFCFMNYAVFAGLLSLIKGQQSVVWEKAKRA